MSDSAAPDSANAETAEPDALDLFGFAAAARQKAERRRSLHEALAGGPPEPVAGESARARLEQLLDAETLATVDEHLLVLLAGDGDPAGTPDVVTAARAGKADGKRALADVLRGRRPQSPLEPNAPISFDGGARASLPSPPPSHEQQLVEVIRSRAADRGARF